MASVVRDSAAKRRGARRSRPGPMMTTGVPLGLSLALHALLLLGTAAVVWRVSSSPPPAKPPVSISFFDPGQGAVLPEFDAPAPESGEVGVGASAPAPSPAALGAAAAAREPAPMPSLRGMAADGAAPSLRAAEPGEPPRLIRGDAPAGGEIRFAGLGASDAQSVVYVVDGSGPMVSSLPIVLEEVLRSVSRLGPSQKFGVVIFRRGRGPGPGYEWFTPALIRATPDAVQRLAAWLREVEPHGQSNPLDGLRAAFSMEPDAIFLLSRSIERSGGGVWELGLESTMRELDRLNPVHPVAGTRPVVIKTIQFLDEDPTGVMQEIARVHGGVTRQNPNPADAYTVIRRAAELRDRGVADDQRRSSVALPPRGEAGGS